MNPLPPTNVPELNAVLEDLSRQWQELLGENLIGAYLLGSFAVGDPTERSDVDFLVVTRTDIPPEALNALQRLHAEFHRRPSYWAQHLEGSYAPAAVIRRLSDDPRDPPGEPVRLASSRDPETGLPPRRYPFLFLGNGSDTLVRSEHDNTLVVRWVMRERGVVLHGPPPATLIDSITGEEIRHDARVTLPRYCAPYLSGDMKIDAVWLQAFFVTLICRMLHTIEVGEIHSKKAATAWALGALPREWHGLITRAAATWAGSQEFWHLQPRPQEVAQTLEFMRYASPSRDLDVSQG